MKVPVLKLPFLRFHGLCRVLRVKLLSLQAGGSNGGDRYEELYENLRLSQHKSDCVQHHLALDAGTSPSLPPTARLSLAGVQLTADSVGPAELLLQLAGALHVHSVALLQEAHLPAQVSQVLQLPLVRFHQGFELVHPVRRVPEGEEGSAWEVWSCSTGTRLVQHIRVVKNLTVTQNRRQCMKFIFSLLLERC